MSSRRLTRVVLPAQYRSSRSEGSSGSIAEQYVRTSPVPTVRPAPRSSRQKSTSMAANGASVAAIAWSATGRDLREVVAHDVEVVPILDDSAESVVRGLRRQVGLAEEAERAHPVDRLSHARRLSQLQLPQAVHRRHNFPGELLGRGRLADKDNLHLAVGRGVADPVIQAATPQRVVEFPGPVGGEDHRGRGLRTDGANLRDADLEVRQDFQQERLELVVRSVYLVDEQDSLIARPDRREQRPFQQELRTKKLVDRLLVGRLALRQRPDLQHLPGVVPLVQRLIGVNAFVALKADQRPSVDGSKHLGDLGLADPYLALEQHGPTQRQ